MQKIVTLFFLTIVSFAEAQKQDYYWPFGSDQDNAVEGVQAIEFDFNNSPFSPKQREGGLEFDQNNSAICDGDGNLLFYTNGCAVANRLHEQMPNGDSINAGLFFDTFWGGDCRNGYPGGQDITILPDPAYEMGYYIIHKTRHMDSITELRWMKDLSYTYVDLSQDNSLGDVVEKNISFYEGELLWSYLTTISHANGKDWWIINPVHPHGFLVSALTEEGVNYSSIQAGPIWDERYSGASGDAKFSPDGRKYACFNEVEGLLLYDFDREQGSLANEQHIPWSMGAGNSGRESCEWSPNSRFLYLTQPDTLWQLDTRVVPLEDGLEFIAEHNGVNDPLSTAFFRTTLGPDCRIYIRSGSSTNTFHVINKPDEKGVACDLVQQGIRLPYISSTGSFPNFPRFRVDEEEKCDPSIVSIVGETVWWRRDLTVYPNPTRGLVTVEVPESKRGRMYVVDMSGQIVMTKKVEVLTGEVELFLGQLVAGTYSVEFVPRDHDERVVWTSKVVVVE